MFLYKIKFDDFANIFQQTFSDAELQNPWMFAEDWFSPNFANKLTQVFISKVNKDFLFNLWFIEIKAPTIG